MLEGKLLPRLSVSCSSECLKSLLRQPSLAVDLGYQEQVAGVLH